MKQIINVIKLQVHYKGNGFVVILISNYLKTSQIPVVNNLQKIY